MPSVRGLFLNKSPTSLPQELPSSEGAAQCVGWGDAVLLWGHRKWQHRRKELLGNNPILKT